MTTSFNHASQNLDTDYGAGTWGGHIYACLTTTAPVPTGDGSIVEPSAGQFDTYAEVAIIDDATHWPAAAAGIKQNGVAFSFPIAGGGSTPGIPLTHLVFRTASGGGKILDAIPLPTGTAVVIGQALLFPALSVSISER